MDVSSKKDFVNDIYKPNYINEHNVHPLKQKEALENSSEFLQNIKKSGTNTTS